MSEVDVSNIKVVFMDIGGILLTNGWGHESRQKAARVFSFDYEEVNELHDFIYNVFEIGSITIDQYLDTVLFDRPRDFTKAEFKQFMFDQSVELPDMLPWVKSWKNEFKLPLFALSNESRELNDFRIQKFKLHELFDGFFSSCYLGFRKPDPRIFKMALEVAQVDPDDCLYFDDRPLLINAAKQQGIRSVLHKDFRNTKHILESLNKRP